MNWAGIDCNGLCKEKSIAGFQVLLVCHLANFSTLLLHKNTTQNSGQASAVLTMYMQPLPLLQWESPRPKDYRSPWI